jgi:hypothetical protein
MRMLLIFNTISSGLFEVFTLGGKQCCIEPNLNWRRTNFPSAKVHRHLMHYWTILRNSGGMIWWNSLNKDSDSYCLMFSLTFRGT